MALEVRLSAISTSTLNLNSRYGGPCLALHVEKLVGYYYMAAAVFLYFLSGFDGSYSWLKKRKISRGHSAPGVQNILLLIYYCMDAAVFLYFLSGSLRE